MTCVGTLQANRKGLPESFKSTKDRPEGDYQVLYEVDGKKSIHSWITNTKSGKKGQKPDSDYGGGGVGSRTIMVLVTAAVSIICG
jgi:hypothetical protein